MGSVSAVRMMNSAIPRFSVFVADKKRQNSDFNKGESCTTYPR